MNAILAQLPIGAIQWLHLLWCIAKVWIGGAAFIVAFAAIIRHREK